MPGVHHCYFEVSHAEPSKYLSPSLPCTSTHLGNILYQQEVRPTYAWNAAHYLS